MIFKKTAYGTNMFKTTQDEKNECESKLVSFFRENPHYSVVLGDFRGKPRMGRICLKRLTMRKTRRGEYVRNDVRGEKRAIIFGFFVMLLGIEVVEGMKNDFCLLKQKFLNLL